jgi:hypothetical protein
MVKIYWNKPSSDTGDAANDKYLAQTIKFAIVANSPGTTTPGTGTPKSGTPKSGAPTPSPTKKTGSAGSPFVWRWEPGVS